MSRGYLILIALGPVQDFIVQARRTRDLWFGSHLLSELSRACAAGLAEAGAALIFPALEKGATELEPCDQPTRPQTNKPPVAVANKILAELPGDDPAQAVQIARTWTFGRWHRLAQSVRNRKLGGRSVSGLIAPAAERAWDEQIRDLLEFYAVWTPLTPCYKHDRNELEQALAARKSLRAFQPWLAPVPGASKSSLHGGRVSVLKSDRRDKLFDSLRINSTEHLDAIGLVKRAGFDPEQFVPIVNIAAGSWVAEAMRSAPDSLARLRGTCEKAGVPRVVRPIQVAERFPLDASVLYPFRWDPLFREIGIVGTARTGVEHSATQLIRQMRGVPPAYVACLVADGDKMGEAIDALPDADRNRDFSKGLACFPHEAQRIVEKDHGGALIYAGGDDVLAFLPVDQAVACAAALKEAFHRALASANRTGKVPTLSVGLGIGHALEAMSDLLNLGRDAERLAKRERNALAVIVEKRSGGRREVLLSWDKGPVKRINDDQDLLKGPLSTRKLYALETLCRRLPGAPGDVLRAYAADLLMHGTDETMTLGQLGVLPKTEPKDVPAALKAALDRVLTVRAMGGENRA